MRGVMGRLFTLSFVFFVSLVGPGAAETPKDPRILVIGDSLLASHSISGRSIGHYLEKMLREPVERRPVAGARMIYRLPISGALGMSIPKQFHAKKDWDWVVMNGGGNDLWLGCGCQKCDRKLDRLISKDGRRGEIPRLMARILNSGSRVIYVGYLRSPGIQTPIEDCKDEGDELEARIAHFAERVKGVHYVSIRDLVPAGNLSYFTVDRIHPSLKASREIAARVARSLVRWRGMERS